MTPPHGPSSFCGLFPERFAFSLSCSARHALNSPSCFAGMIFAMSCSVSALICRILSRFFSGVRAGSVQTSLIFPLALSWIFHRWFMAAGEMPACLQHSVACGRRVERGEGKFGCCGVDSAGACSELCPAEDVGAFWAAPLREGTAKAKSRTP
jgi:hypothetical protein